YDWDLTTPNKIVDPAVLAVKKRPTESPAQPKPDNGMNGSGGCDAGTVGAFALAALTFAGAVMMRRNKK
ncbi:MAG: hypothetical protein LBT08_04445, partial [Synergistaceae bacterium]|nr:hypothetical protein [Synergistaceae bacterium]